MPAKYFVTCFVDGGFDEVVAGYKDKEQAKRFAARMRKRNGIRDEYVNLTFRVVPAGTFRRMGVDVNTLPGARS